jgi:nucleoside-diphosphate-sugar epimerase
MKRILITGAAGFIGLNLANHLSEDPNIRLTLVDNFLRGRRDEELEAVLARPNVDLIEADLTDPESFRRFGDGFDEVYHLAAVLGVQNVLTRPYEVVRINTLSTVYLLDWFRQGGGRKLLFSSTSEVYAWTQQFYPLPIPTPESVPLALTELANPRSTYAGSKVLGELAVTHGCASAGRPLVIVRYHNVYGPRMGFDHVIPQLAQRALAGQNPLVVYSASHSRGFCYVSDAVTATVAAMGSEKANGETINIGNDKEEVAMGELARRILASLKLAVPIMEAVAKHDPIQRRCPNISKARALLGYEPQINLNMGLNATLAWYRKVLPARNE